MIKVQNSWELQIKNKINLGIIKKENLYKKIILELQKINKRTNMISIEKFKNLKFKMMNFIKFYL